MEPTGTNFEKSNQQQAEHGTSSYNKYPARSLILLFAIHRFFTFPLHFRLIYSTELLQMLVELGFFYENNNVEILRCYFCEMIITVDELSEYLSRGIEYVKIMIMRKQQLSKCRMDDTDSNNVPMGIFGNVLNFKFEACRLYSLLKKIDWEHVEPFALAKSGFYYTGDGDKVRCTFCNLEVHRWEEGDTPDGEHTRWNPKCPFMRNRQSVQNIEIGNELLQWNQIVSNIPIEGANVPINRAVPNNPHRRSKVALPSKGANVCVDNKMKFGKHFHILGDDVFGQYRPSDDFNIKVWSCHRYPQYVTLKGRIDSFKAFWPRCLKQTPFEMAKVGFFHTGYGDFVICFHCNLGLNHWDPNDDPFVEHYRWNTKCQFLLMCKGQRCIDQMLQLIKKTNLVMSSTGKYGWQTTPLNPEFAIYTSRYDSLDFLPKGDRKTAIARAGFFYTKIDDRFVCFHCNLIIKEWDPNDDPYVKHCRLNAECWHLMMCKGKSSYVKHVLQFIQNPEASGSREGDLRCLKCNLNIVSKVNLPCGHMTFCRNCSEPLCEKCSKEMSGWINIPGFTSSDTIHATH